MAGPERTIRSGIARALAASLVALGAAAAHGETLTTQAYQAHFEGGGTEIVNPKTVLEPGARWEYRNTRTDGVATMSISADVDSLDTGDGWSGRFHFASNDRFVVYWGGPDRATYRIETDGKGHYFWVHERRTELQRAWSTT